MHALLVQCYCTCIATSPLYISRTCCCSALLYSCRGRTPSGLFVYTDQIGRSMGVWSRSLMQEGIANQAASPAWGWRVVTAFAIFPALFLVVVTM